MKGRANGERPKPNGKGGNARGGGNRQQERKTAEDLMKRALASQEAGRCSEAVGIYEEALSVCPEHLDCMYNLAVCLIERAEVSCQPRATKKRQLCSPSVLPSRVSDVHSLLFLRTQIPSSSPTVGTVDMWQSRSDHTRYTAPPWDLINKFPRWPVLFTHDPVMTLASCGIPRLTIPSTHNSAGSYLLMWVSVMVPRRPWRSREGLQGARGQGVYGLGHWGSSKQSPHSTPGEHLQYA